MNTFRLLCFVALAIATQSCGGFLQTAIHDSGTREEEDDDDNVAPSLIFEETAASVLLGYPIEINPIKNLGGKIENCTIEPDVTQITGLLFNTQTCAISGSATHSIAPTLYTVTAQNQNGSHQIQFSFGVRPVVSIEETLVNVSASTLSLGQTISVVVQTKNSSGANLSSGGAIVELSLSGGTSQGSFSQVVDIGDGTYTAIFTGSTPGTATSIKATIDGFGQVLDSKLITVLPGAISNTQSTVGITSGTITSGTTSSVILQAKDAAGNNISSFGADVVFSLTGAGTSSGTFSVVTDHEDGTYSAVFTGTTAGTAKTISATINGDLATSTSSVTVNVGSISTATSTITSSADTIVSGSTSTITLQAKDAAGNNLLSGEADVVFSLTGDGTSSGTFSVVTDHQNGSYSAIFTGTTAGTAKTISATIGGNAVVDLSSITVQEPTISPLTSTVSASSPSITANGTSTITLQAKDAAGNNISSFGADVVFSLTGDGTSSGTFSVVTDHEDGTYSAVFTGTTAGTAKTISATINGDLATSTSSVTVNVGSISTATSTVTSSADTIVSGSTSTVTLQAKDAAGNNLLSGEADVVFSLTGAGTSSGTFSVVTDHEDGTYSAIFTGTTAGDAKTISATINTVTVSDTSEITVNPGTASKLVFTAEDSSLTTDTCSSILTLQLQDSNNNVVTQSGSNRLLTLSSAKTGGGSLTGSTTYFSNSSCNVPIADPETDFFISVGVSSASFYIKHSHEENITLTVASDTLTSATSNISIANPIAFNCEDSPPDISFTCGTTTVRMDLLMDCYWCHEAGAGEMYWDEIDNNFKLEISELAAQCDGPVSCSKSGPSPFGSYCNGDIMVTDNYSAPCPDAQTPCTSWLNHDAQYLIEGQFTDIDSETGECMAPQAFWAIVKGPADPNDFSCSYQSMQIQDRSDNIAYASLSLSCGSWDINIASGATATTSKRTGANPIGSYTADVSSCDPDAPSAGLSGVTVVIDP